MNTVSKTETKISTSSAVASAVVVLAGIGLLGMAAGLLPGIVAKKTPDLVASASVDVDALSTVGDELTYTVTVYNVGKGAAPVSVMTDRIASGTLELVSASTKVGACEISSSTVACPMPAIGAGKSATATIKVKLASNALACGASGTIKSLVTVDAKEEISELDDVTNNTATTTTTLNGPCGNEAAGNANDLPNLVVGDVSVPSASGIITATLGNVGKADVSVPVGVYFYFDDVLKKTYVSSTLSDQNFLLTGGSSTISPQKIDATTKTVRVCVDPAEAVSESDEADNCFTWSLEGTPTGASQTQASATTTSSEGIDLTVTKIADSVSLPMTATVPYTIVVGNEGTVDAVNVWVTDTITDTTGLTAFVSASGTNGFVCTVSGSTVTCKNGRVPAGSQATILVVGAVAISSVACDTSKTISDTATVDPLNKISETNEDNNLATASVIVTNPCGGSSTVTTTTGGGSSVSGTDATASAGSTYSVPNR